MQVNCDLAKELLSCATDDDMNNSIILCEGKISVEVNMGALNRDVVDRDSATFGQTTNYRFGDLVIKA